VNRKARFDYFIEESYEAGISLLGWEVKSMRAGKAQVAEAYVYLKNGEAFLYGAHISPPDIRLDARRYGPDAPRKLLLSRRQLDHLVVRWSGAATRLCRCNSIEGSRAKLEIGLAKGKKNSTTSVHG